jgi:myo-inositol 2-dehydrogenase/D-chiro-inositol 1-dehydrogenase
MSTTRHSFRPEETVRLAVLGVGNIGKVHLQSAIAMDDVTVIAVADAIEANRAYARSAGVDSVYDDYADLLRTEPVDVAIVALPPFLHAETVELAARRGCHVFVEKPLARTTAEARSLVDTAAKAEIAVGVDHTIRYLPDVRRVHNKYQDGIVGAVPYATISRVNFGPFTQPPAERAVPGWHLDPEAAGGGVLLELGVHLLDVLEWTFGEMSVRAAETSSQLDLPVEDAATLLLRSEATGTQVTLHCGSYQWEDDEEFNMTFRLEGMTGTLDSQEYSPDSFYGNAAASAIRNVARRLAGREPAYYAPTYYLQAYFAALRDFLDAVRDGDQPPVSGSEGLRTVELVETAYDLAAEGRATTDEPLTPSSGDS